MIAEEDMVIAITRSGYIKRLPVHCLPRAAARWHRRDGHGDEGRGLHRAPLRRFDAPTTSSSSPPSGKVYRLKVHELPLGSRQSKGRAIVNLLPLRQDELIRAVIATRDFKEAKYLVFATEGRASSRKPSSSSTTHRSRPTGSSRSRCAEDDELIGVRLSERERRHPDGLAGWARPCGSVRRTSGRWDDPP